MSLSMTSSSPVAMDTLRRHVATALRRAVRAEASDFRWLDWWFYVVVANPKSLQTSEEGDRYFKEGDHFFGVKLNVNCRTRLWAMAEHGESLPLDVLRRHLPRTFARLEADGWRVDSIKVVSVERTTWFYHQYYTQFGLCAKVSLLNP